jgi:NADH-quinone oxidoreductase subunit L
MLSFLPLIIALPLAGFFVLLFFGRRLGNPGAGIVASVAVGLSFVATVITYFGLLSRTSRDRVFVDHLFTWFAAGRFHVAISLYLDPLSMTMALFVTGIATLIHVYSIGYMNHDPKFSKFFVYLNLFVFSMVVLVLSGNLPLTFLGWEGVGACSYFLIAFWHERPSAASAGKKAFIINRIGDFGFLIGSFLVFSALGTMSYVGIFHHDSTLSTTTATAIALLFFVGAVGKSAQMPLYVWLVDAMEGPTPVSALIHAATMVTAGVYLMARLSPILHLSASASWVIAIVGAATAFIGATSATAQSDIKKVLAYSTVSQLGFMFLGIGSHAYVAAIFLMITHAFYKALLFLGAGSVIHGMHDEQDIKKMGALRRFMPITAVTFILAWLSIAGVPPFSGFWSKGDVLSEAYAMSPVLWLVGVLAAILTAYYMGREVFLVFYGPARWKDPKLAGEREHAEDPHESPKVMTVPLVILCVLAVFGGALDLPLGHHFTLLENWLAPVFIKGGVGLHLSSTSKLVLALADAVFAIVGVLIAVRLWSKRWNQPKLEPSFFRAGWHVDDIYDASIAVPSTVLATDLDEIVDKKIIDGAVLGIGGALSRLAQGGRAIQSGYVRSYALVISLGVVVLLGYVITRAGS